MTNNNSQTVVVTLTTIPSRLTQKYGDDIRSNLNSLLNQSFENYEINLNIPLALKLTGEEYIIPEFLNKLADENPKLKIFRTDDLGPLTKLYSTIERISDPNAIIIVCDDDLVYHQDMVKEQVLNQELWKEEIVGYDGLRSRDNIFNDVRDYYFTSNYRTSRVDILQHYKTVSYKRRYFEDDFKEFVKENFSWSDDLLIAAYFSFKLRDRIATFHHSDEEFKTLEEWSTRGGVASFPVLRHTQHDSIEGCNIYRGQNITDNGDNLFKKFIDRGYNK